MVTEVKLEWDRLDVLIVRRMGRRGPKKASPGPLPDHQVTTGARSVGRITLVGLGAQAWFRSDTQIQGKISGIGVDDLSSPGTKYHNIVSMGTEGFVQKTVNVMDTGYPATTGHSDDLSFLIERSLQPQTTQSSGPQYRIFVSLSMPSIHYTHSVDFIYEMEAFVSDFKFYSGQLSDSLRKAAVGVARGLVGPKSHLAEGLDKLAFLGPAKTSMSLDDEMEGDGIDGAPPSSSAAIENHQLLYDISIQSPVIVVPSSLSGEDTLIAHLGEISLRNDFTLECDDFASLCPERIAQIPRTERIALKVTNMSLHASHDGESREWLISMTTATPVGQRPVPSRPGRWCKVLKETSVELRIDRCIWGAEGEEGSGEAPALRPDVILVGKIVDPVLVRLPKEVFDHIQKILRHGLHKSSASKPSRCESIRGADSGPVPMSSGTESQPTSVSSSGGQGEGLPKMICSFSLAKLSFELKHMIEFKERDLVFVSFEDFSFHCKKLDPSVASFKLSLKSIVIEDLLQQKDSDYRYLFASSTKPLPFLLPLSSSFHNLRSQSFGNLLPPLGRQLLLMVQPGASFRQQTLNYSPLRSFSSRRSLSREGSEGPKLSLGKGDSHGGGHDLGSPTSSASSGVSDLPDLLSIEGQYCDKHSLLYSTKYNSVS